MKLTLLIVGTVALFTSGCSSFQELHYFKSESPPGETPNYFRLSIQGVTLLSSSRYISGYFDERIVDQYFNEISQPGKARLLPVGQSKPGDASATDAKDGTASASATVNPATEAPNPALVLLLSSNSDDIANQLGALAQSEEFTNSIATLVGASRFEKAYEAEQLLANDRLRAKSLATTGDQLIANLATDATSALAVGNTLAFVNAIAADLGVSSPFTTLTEAKTWLEANRARLLSEKR